MKCKFNKAWIGECGAEADESGYCEEHKEQKCVSCGAKATHDCPETGQFVCGAPLCDDCQHCIFPDGTNGGIGFNAVPCPDDLPSCRHCKKGEQKYKPWYDRKTTGQKLRSDLVPCRYRVELDGIINEKDDPAYALLPITIHERRQGGSNPCKPEGESKWSIQRGELVLSKDGEWVEDPMASQRTPEYLERTRFDSVEEACEFLAQLIDSKVEAPPVGG